MPLVPPSSQRTALGLITHGSLAQGVEMKLTSGRSIETLRAGKFVVIEGERYDFFSLVTDMTITAANDDILLNPPTEELLRRVLQGSGTYATINLKPQLMVERGLDDKAEVLPVRTIPAHFAKVGEATQEDVSRVFGHEALDGGNRYFQIGTPLDMDTPVCLDLKRFVERSNAVFGKTGTGKSFLTRVLLAGVIKTGRAATLIFDMHNEYGWQAKEETSQGMVFTKGLQQLFPTKVRVFTLDPASTRLRGRTADVDVFLYADQIEPEDILPLRDTLNLNATAAESTFLLSKQYKHQWLIRLLEADAEGLKTMTEETGANEASLAALKRKLERLRKLPFFKLESSRGKVDIIDQLLSEIGEGRSVVLEFGQFNEILVYLFVANVLTRRLRHDYEAQYNRYEGTQNEADRPQQLLITIEEAHKFLGPETAHETPFGKIAREMRKFSVSLLIVDQRPSGIDEEVLSQIGTKVVAQLSDDKDLNAALVGTSGASALRQVLATLESKQQALVLGHAVPMPVVLKTRTYDQAFFDTLADSPLAPSADAASLRAGVQGLF